MDLHERKRSGFAVFVSSLRLKVWSYTVSERSLVPRPFYARGARWERDKGLVPVVRACVEFYWNPGKIVFFGIF